MQTIKKTIAAITMTGIILLGTSFANAGIIILGAKEQSSGSKTTQQCSETSGPSKANSGIIILGFTGIIILGLTGIIILGAKESTATNCGIIILG